MYEKELKICKEVVLEASEKILEIYNTDFEVMRKKDKSPITIADIEANKIYVIWGTWVTQLSLCLWLRS